MELDAEQIIRCLECCKTAYDCFTCDNFHRGCTGFREDLAKSAVALIKSYERKIFELENRLKECENGYEGTLALERAKIKELTEENERLENALVEQSAENVMLCVEIKHARADTVREMQERLKYTLCINNEENTDFFDYEYTLETIDKIAKEMLEGE
jgi:hypothetical protein